MVSALEAFHFLRPALLWALAPFVAYALALWFRAREGSPWESALESRFLKHLVTGKRLRAFVTPDVMLIPLGVVAVLAAAGPTWAPQAQSGDPSKSPLAVVVELSRSMAGTDVSPSRAERARLELRDLVHARPTSPTALVVVAGSAHVLMPMTDDPSVLEPYLDALSPDLMPFDGQAFARTARLLQPMANDATAPLSVLLVTDGMPPDGAAALTELHRTKGVGYVVLAVGSSKGDPAHAAPPLDLSGLERFADGVDAELVELSFGERDVGKILHAIALHRSKTLARNDASFWEDSGWLFAVPLALAVAFWFRRGWALRGAALFGLLLLTGCEGHVADVWLTPDQQGRILFDAGRYREAAERFRDPMWRGLAFYAQGRFADAASAFAAVDTKEGLYNLGNAHAQGGKLGSAIRAYDRTLAKSPAFRDARHNADLIREILRSQQEDTDQEDQKQAEKNHGDAATEVSPEELVFKTPPEGSKESAPEPEEAPLSPAEEAAWLRHVKTEPSDFLKRKLAALAAREGQ